MSDSLEAYVDRAMSTLPSRLLEFIVKHGGWAQALDYVDGLESLARQHREEVEAAEAALGEAMTLLSDIQADQSWRSNDNTLWPRIVAITRTSKETT